MGFKWGTRVQVYSSFEPQCISICKLRSEMGLFHILQIVFPSAVVKMDHKSEFERVPVTLLTAAVDLVAEMARVDPDGEWCRWQGKVRYLKDLFLAI